MFTTVLSYKVIMQVGIEYNSAIYLKQIPKLLVDSLWLDMLKSQTTISPQNTCAQAHLLFQSIVWYAVFRKSCLQAADHYDS